MDTSFLFRRRTRQATTIVLLLITVLTMAAAEQPALHWGAAQAAWVACIYLLMAMVLLVFSRTRLMFVCLGCSAAISLFFYEIKTPAAATPLRDGYEQTDDSLRHESTPTHR